MIFAMFVKYLTREASVSHVLETWIDFISQTIVGGERGVSEMRVANLHFAVLRYYALFSGRCLTGRGQSGTLSSPGLAILRHALYADRTFSLCAMFARRLHTNRTKGGTLSSPDLVCSLHSGPGLVHKSENFMFLALSCCRT